MCAEIPGKYSPCGILLHTWNPRMEFDNLPRFHDCILGIQANNLILFFESLGNSWNYLPFPQIYQAKQLNLEIVEFFSY